MAKFSDLLANASASVLKNNGKTNSSSRLTGSSRVSFDTLIDQAQAELKRPKISLDAGQQQFLNTLTDPSEKYEYLLSVDPSRASAMRQNTERLAEGYRQQALSVPVSNQPDASKSYFRNYAVPPTRTEEEKLAISRANAGEASANKKLQVFDEVDKRAQEQALKEAQKRSAPTYAMLATLPENEVIDYLQDVNPALARSRQAQNELVETRRAFYGMTIDQFEKELAESEQEFYDFYTTKYNPQDPESVREYERLVARNEFLLENKSAAYFITSAKKYADIPHKEDFTFQSNLTFDSKRSREKLLEQGYTEHELSIYTYLYNTEGKESADRYVDYIDYMKKADENAIKVAETREAAKADAENLNILWSSLKAVGATIASGAGMMDALAQKGGQVLGEMFGGGVRAPADLYSSATPSVYATTVLQVNAENINNKHGTINLNPETNPVMAHIFNGVGWGDAYQLAMSMANSGIAAGMSAVIPFSGLAMLSGSAATSTMIQYAENGATDDQAIAMGLIAGFAEAVMEALPMESLLNGNWAKSGLGEILKQGLTEGAEEGGTSLMNLAADVFIMAQNSDFQRNVQAYIDNGTDEEAAYKRACWDKVIEIGWDVVGGLVSGGAMGSLATIGGRGTHTVSVLEVKKAQPLSVYKALTPSLVERVLEADPFDKQAIAIRDTISENGIDAVKAADLYKFIADNVDEYNATVYHTRKAMEEAAEATKAASEAMTKSAAAQPVATEATPTYKTYPPVIQDVVNKLKQGPVTNAAYNAVYDAALADASLQAVLGVDLTSNGGLTKAQQRQAVKTALQNLANPTTTKVETVKAEETAPASEEAAPPAKEAKVVEVKAKTHSTSAAKPKAISSLDVVVAAHKNGDKNAVTKFTTAAMNSKPLQAQIKKAWGVDLSQVASNSEKRTLIFNAIKSRASEAQATEVETKPEVTEANANPASSGDFAKVLSKDEYIKDQGISELPSKMQTDAYRQYVDSLTEAVASSKSITYNGEVMTFDKYLETRNAARAAEGKGAVDVTTARKMFYDNYVNELKAQEKEAEIVEANEKLVVALNAKLADFGSRCTVRLSTDEVDFPKNIKGETAFYDANANEIVINARVATTAKIILRKFGHEIFHPAADVDSKLVDDTIKAFRELNDDGKLTGKAKEWMDNYDDRIATIRELYQRHENRVAKLKGREAAAIDDEKAKLELACDLFGELFEKTEMADGLVEKNPSAGATIVDRLNKLLAKLNLGHIETKEEKEIKAVADKLSSLEERVKSALVQKAKSGEGVSKNHSISSMASAAGIEAIRDESGRIVFVAKDGTPINRVLPEDIKSSSGLGALIKAAQSKELHGKKAISEAEAEKQYKAVAEIMNMIIETQDPDMVWQFVGASMFSAIKSNADGQYGTTVDFSTICRKTQDMISAMSHAMKKLGRGLTKAEVTELQKKLIEEGSAVPCPVCYVFSRWAGIGSVLDKMAAWQDKYESYDADAIKARIEELSKTTKKADLRKMLKAQDEEYQKLNQEAEKLSRTLTGLRKQLKAAKAEDANHIKGQISIAELQRAHLKDQLKTIEESAAGELSWLINVRSQDGYKAVPKDILYDLENAEAFASDEYALSWKYRTSRGPSAGKAILPYADMRLGDMILGVGKTSADGNTLFAETTGEFTDKQMDAVNKAIARTRAQNLIGGQRFQSTSDFRYDYALDYVMAFFEAQALGSNLQTYTKVIEFADMIAAVGGDVNLSVMPKDQGYKDGKLVFSNVTGIDYEAALEANAKYDNAQLILVGINDEHIRLALEDSTETGGNNIGFVIPYHASGASIEEFISALVSNLNEQFVKENYVDYSDVQGDKVKANATEEQSRRRDLRKQLLTGRHKADNGEGKMTSQSWSPEAADFELLVGESVDISNRSFEDLRAVEKKALAGDAEAIREYESWSAGVLRDLYEKLWTSKGAYNGVRLNSTQAAAIMPHEYWNTNTTRANAYVNGFIFRSYCYSMGLNPRFTGKNSSGKTVNHGDFSDSTGYWKTLIDRPMYANDGTYRNQQAVNMSHFEKGMLTKEWAETHWGEYKIKEPSKTNAERAADKFVAERQYSIEDEEGKKNPSSSQTSTGLQNEDSRYSAKQRGLKRISFNAPAAANILGISTIANESEKVKSAIVNLANIYASIGTDSVADGLANPVTGWNLINALCGLGVMTRGGGGSSAYFYGADYALRLSNHHAKAENFRGKHENVSIVFEGKKTRGAFEKANGKNNVIEVVFSIQGLNDNDKLKRLVQDIAQFIATGEYHDTAGADSYSYDGGKKFVQAAKDRMKADKKNRSYSLDEDIGYHAGDLGKSEHLGMISGDRDTGHFGFGTYFVGNRKKIEGYNKRNGKEAPVETVDFSQYNLYRPATNDDGFVLHRFLQSLNAYYDRDPNLVQTPEEYEQAKENIDDYRYEVEELGNTELEEQLIGVAESVLGKYGVAEVVQRKMPVDAWLDSDGTLELTDGTRLDIMDAVNMVEDVRDVNIALYDEVANRWTESAVYRYDGWRYQVERDSKDLFNLTPAEVDALVAEIRDEIAAGNYNWETAKGQDSASTRFMKKLGYEGIDVRHLSQLDNTTYGSVIYDLKGKDLARKQEIGTARYSLENDELSALEDQLMADLDTTFSALDLVEGTAEISAEYVEAYNNAIATARDLAIKQTQAVERLAAEMGRKREQAALKRTHQVKLKAIKAEAASKADNAKLAENMGHQREMLQQKRKYDAKLAKQKLAAEDKLENVRLAEAMGHKREMGQQKRKYEDKLVAQKVNYEQRLETAKEEAAVRLGNVKLAEKMGHQREMLQQKRELKEKAKVAVATEREKGKAVADSLKAKTKQQRQLARNKAKIALRAQSAAQKKMAQEAIKNGEVKTVREYEAVSQMADVFKKDKVMKNATLAAQAVANKLKGAYRNFVSGGQAVEAFSRRQKGVQARTLAVSLQSAETTIERIFKNGLVDTAGNTIGKSLADVLLVYQTKNGKVTSKVDMQKMAIFQDYLLHAHNVDRMSIEEKAMAEVSAFLEEHSWIEGMTNKEIARIASLTDKEATKEGEIETRAILGEYLALLENVNKAKNKPVFADSKGNAVSAETSRGIVAKYEAEHEWLAEKAQGLYEWWETFMRTWVVGTSITEAQYESMKALYPHYVPTFRVVKKGGKSFGGTTLSPTQVVKAAKGSTLSIVDIENSFARLVSNGVTGYRENELFKNIVDTFMLDDGDTQEFGDIGYFDSSCFEDEAQKTTTDTEDQTQEKIETDEKVGLVKDKDGYRVSAWYNGELRSAYVTEEFFKSLQHFTGEDLGEVGKAFIRVGSAITGPMKTAITGINPSFAARNLSRDLPTAIVNSVSGASFIKYWGQAGYDMMAAGLINNEQLANILSVSKVDLPKMEGRAERYQNFVNLGGTNSGYYNANKGFIDNVKGDNIFSKGIQAMGAFNEATEAMTRYAEYIATLDRLGDTYENRLLAIYNSAEVTVNFGRHGKYGKVINAWIPYWNPAVQGIDKVVRSVIDSPEGKAWYKQAVKTLGRAALTSLLPEALLMIAISACGRRDEWEKLTDRMKDTYYCIPWFKENRFLKIPKNREWGAILGTPLMRLFEYANGREDPFENYVETSLIPNFLPPGFFDAIGISQAMDLWKNEDFAGRQIVPSAYLKGSKEFQYDAETSILARGLAALIGHKLGAMQIDYIIEAYFGDFGDMATKLFSPATWQRDPEGTAAALLDIVVSPWIGDNRYSNQDVSDYYELLDTFDMLEQDAKNHGTEDAYHETPDYLSAAAIERLYGSQITALNKQAREMDDGVEKDAIKAEISRLATEALMLDAAIRSGDFSEYAKASTIFDADTTQALLELYKEVNTVGVFLQEPDRKFSVDGVEVILSDAELETYSQNRRSIATAQVAELVSSSRYSKMSVEEREKAVGQVYDFATQLAKQDITNGEYKPATWITATQQAMQDTGVPISAVIDYRIALSAENDKPDVTSKQANSTIRGQLLADNSLPTEQRNALDDIVFSDVTIIPNDKKVDYTSEETFVITQMSEGAQTRWPDIKRRFQISAETYNKAWSIYYNDELNAAEKKAELGKLLGSSLRGNGLYRALGEKLDK